MFFHSNLEKKLGVLTLHVQKVEKLSLWICCDTVEVLWHSRRRTWKSQPHHHGIVQRNNLRQNTNQTTLLAFTFPIVAAHFFVPSLLAWRRVSQIPLTQTVEPPRAAFGRVRRPRLGSCPWRRYIQSTKCKAGCTSHWSCLMVKWRKAEQTFHV